MPEDVAARSRRAVGNDAWEKTRNVFDDRSEFRSRPYDYGRSRRERQKAIPAETAHKAMTHRHDGNRRTSKKMAGSTRYICIS